MHVARKLQIEEIKKGIWKERYLLSPYGERLWRARLLGWILKKFVRADYGHLLLNDGSAQLRAKTFSQEKVAWLRRLKLSQLVDCSGQLQEWKGEVYLKLEFIHSIEDLNWISLRFLEIAQRLKKLSRLRNKLIKLRKQSASDQDFLELAKKKELSNAKAMLETGLLSSKKEEKRKCDEERLLKLIKKLDSGEGVKFEKLLAESELPNKELDELVGRLLAKGVCFEPHPGRIRSIKE